MRQCVYVLIIVAGCSRPPAAPPAETPAAKPAPAAVMANLLERVDKEGGLPPVIGPSSLLSVYDDNRLAGDRIYKYKFVQLTGPIKKIDGNYGRVWLVFGDNAMRAIELHVHLAKEDRSLFNILKKDEVITVWGRVEGVIGNAIEVRNAVLLTKDRQDAIEKRLKSKGES